MLFCVCAKNYFYLIIRYPPAGICKITNLIEIITPNKGYSIMVTVQAVIESKLQEALNPSYLLVENESHMHGGSALESHFKVTVVADAFNGQRLLQRHRIINQLLAEELKSYIHALAMHTYTPTEWDNVEQPRSSPDCRGGSKHI